MPQVGPNSQTENGALGVTLWTSARLGWKARRGAGSRKRSGRLQQGWLLVQVWTEAGNCLEGCSWPGGKDREYNGSERLKFKCHMKRGSKSGFRSQLRTRDGCQEELSSQEVEMQKLMQGS